MTRFSSRRWRERIDLAYHFRPCALGRPARYDLATVLHRIFIFLAYFTEKGTVFNKQSSKLEKHHGRRMNSPQQKSVPDGISILFLASLPLLVFIEIDAGLREGWRWNRWIMDAWLIYPFGAIWIIRLNKTLKNALFAAMQATKTQR